MNGADLKLDAASKGSWIELFLPVAGKTPKRTNSTPRLVKPLFLKLMNQTLPHFPENVQVQVVEVGAAGNNPERANAAQAPAPLGANLMGDTC